MSDNEQFTILYMYENYFVNICWQIDRKTDKIYIAVNTLYLNIVIHSHKKVQEWFVEEDKVKILVKCNRL